MFGAASGQSVNKAESCILFSQNTPSGVVSSISGLLGIAPTSNLGRYLGMPIISGRKGKADCSFLIEKTRSKLSRWKTSTLSQAGRVPLAQSCIMSIPNYVMQIQVSCIPASIWDKVERMCCDFIWGSTLEVRCNHLISWATICSPKDKGGLGFRSLKMVNSAFLMKLGWALFQIRTLSGHKFCVLNVAMAIS